MTVATKIFIHILIARGAPGDIRGAFFVLSHRPHHEPHPHAMGPTALANAQAEGLTLDDVGPIAEHARTTERFDMAVNELVRAKVG
ncbi:MAG: hypothetical protein ABJL67_03765 [Sulfitobacter sp.]